MTPQSLYLSFTKRERIYARLLMTGCTTNKDIAEAMGIKVNWVQRYATNLFNKTGMGNRVELALFIARRPELEALLLGKSVVVDVKVGTFFIEQMNSRSVGPIETATVKFKEVVHLSTASTKCYYTVPGTVEVTCHPSSPIYQVMRAAFGKPDTFFDASFKEVDK